MVNRSVVTQGLAIHYYGYKNYQSIKVKQPQKPLKPQKLKSHTATIESILKGQNLYQKITRHQKK